jgi:hypothetical protein
MKRLFKWFCRKQKTPEVAYTHYVEMGGATYCFRFEKEPWCNPHDNENFQFLTDIKES